MAEIVLAADARRARPVYLVEEGAELASMGGLPAHAVRWAKAVGFAGRLNTLCIVPGERQEVACALFGLGKDVHPMQAGRLARRLPAGKWRLAGRVDDPYLSSLAFLLGAYRFDAYRKPEPCSALLVPPEGVDREALAADCNAVFLVRDLINRPPNDLGPAELEEAVRAVGKRHGARVTSVRGDDLLKRNFPLIHAVGRASAQAPRLIDLRWGRPADPRVTLVGKGVTFDTGGLNIKSGEAMSLMKKDMGGAANVLGLADRIMAARLRVRLRVIIGAVENAISGSAFRPGDILASRKGMTVEIGNTDAEGRLVLADALALGDEEAPHIMVDMATLTGAARVALGPDLPALFTEDDEFADAVLRAGLRLHDPSWRMPLWKPYRANLASQVADVSHIAKGPFAGAVTAALFLQRFVEKAQCWAHFDIFGWAVAGKPWAPAGGEAFAIRALFDVIAGRFPVDRTLR